MAGRGVPGPAPTRPPAIAAAVEPARARARRLALEYVVCAWCGRPPERRDLDRVVAGTWRLLPACRACGGWWWTDAWAIAALPRWREARVDLYAIE